MPYSLDDMMYIHGEMYAAIAGKDSIFGISRTNSYGSARRSSAR